MPNSVRLAPAARRQLKKLAHPFRDAADRALKTLEEGTYRGRAIRLSSNPSKWRLRQGQLRVVFHRDGDAITVIEIKDRKNAYRQTPKQVSADLTSMGLASSLLSG